MAKKSTANIWFHQPHLRVNYTANLIEYQLPSKFCRNMCISYTGVGRQAAAAVAVVVAEPIIMSLMVG